MLKFKCEIKDGKLILDRAFVQKYVGKQNNGMYLLEIKRFYKKRSVQQNKWYWEILTILCDELGYESKEELHYNLKYTFLGNMDKNGLFFTSSTTKLTTKEMGNYFEKIYKWAAELGIVLPDPIPDY